MTSRIGTTVKSLLRKARKSGSRYDSEGSTPGREEEIAAYVCGDMPAEEAAAFERRMDADAGLRREVEEWRKALAAAEDWAASEPPGIERVDRLATPQLPPRRVSVSRGLRWVLGGMRPRLRPRLATAGVFAAGFVIGAFVFHQPPSPIPPPEAVSGRGLVTAPEEQAVVKPERPAAGETGRPTGVEPSPESRGTRLAGASGPTYTTREDGRLIVETTSPESGTRVVMVVDGGFEVESSSSMRGEEP